MATSCCCYYNYSNDYNCPCHFRMNRAGVTRVFFHQLSCIKISGPGFWSGSGSGSGSGCEFMLPKKKSKWSGRRRFKLVASAELSNSLSVNIGLDSKLPCVGPLPGDVAEVEAFCRIFRAAEQFHNALMDTLCNPVTGECSVSYDMSSEDKPLLENKIVSVLGCMVCLLNKGRDDVLSGRSSIMNSYRNVQKNVMDDNLPPLAIFRGEMKSYCESLHVALENYLTPDDARSIKVWRKLQRLKNVCYDSGFPRGDNHPCQTLFANWGPIYLSTSKEEMQLGDEEVAFWKGSQVTEEGLKWLLEKGFKTIVDLRAETIKDNFYKMVLDEAILSGKIELIKLPVEVGTSPSMEQVEKFSTLVSDSSKKPIYLHSKEGRQRTSAMVSRWRLYMDRATSQFVSNQRGSPTDMLVPDAKRIEGTHFISNLKEDTSSDDGNGSISKEAGGFINQTSSAAETQSRSSNGASITGTTNQDTRLPKINGEIETVINFYSNAKPLESQLPPMDVFSRREMTKFFRNKKISPGTYFIYERRRLEMLSALRYNCNRTVLREETITNSRFKEEDILNRSLNGNMSSSKPLSTPASYWPYQSHNSFVTPAPLPNGTISSKEYASGEKDGPISTSIELNKNVKSTMVTRENRSNSDYLSSDDESLETLEGNMCASATGVVRVQSRKKAEMFLVRTDGFSCSREKVTESSLAFTHPSTQQQMLLWKSTPKTALLLKKLGQELMEEAKEVASFLYYQENMNVLVEPEVHDIFARIPGFGFVQTFYSQDTRDLHERVDFVACLGGDGVILHASNLFIGAVPPVVSFNLGSLGFLTSHTFQDCKNDLKQVIHGNNTLDGVYITLRMRLCCEIFRNGKAVPGKVFNVLNEVVVDRGSNPYLSKIECYEHDHLITKVQGDGVIVATPTGSTAYSTAAGGSMVHPNVPCMLFTPICPHSLSFRPVILPDSARLELKIPEDARSNAWVSFDGKRRQQLSRGDSVRICMSQHPLPTVNKSDQTGDWFRSLIRCLNWNERLDQKAL
ncbi:NAD kinase 2, chloroplastic isoform X1 [Olea europaea var. sylvestris]|uniref:NAD kinase 2, chloroplastic isoform X1 n=1 Tax=Olea europaea var. sylvestris TaxID=158386 RepID=UPI000C1D3ED6|nr:NAD kinase 2, chloroplastic isoform X1 [Olea europaea var. sylvestris]